MQLRLANNEWVATSVLVDAVTGAPLSLGSSVPEGAATSANQSLLITQTTSMNTKLDTLGNLVNDDVVSGTLGTLGAYITVSTVASSTVAVQLTGNLIGTLSIYGTIDGTTWFDLATTNIDKTYVTTIKTFPAYFRVNVQGLSRIKVQIATHISGSIDVYLRGSIASADNILSRMYQQMIGDTFDLARSRHVLFSTAGDGTGATNIISNYSAAATDFYFKATTNTAVYSLLFNLTDNANFAQTSFAGLATALTNGIKFYFYLDDASLIGGRLFNSMDIKANFDWMSITDNVKLTQWRGTNQTLTAKIDMVSSYGNPFLMPEGSRIIARVQDNFTGILGFNIVLQGKEIK